MKKRFNFLEILFFKKELKKSLEKYNPITHKFKFLKVFSEELFFVGNIRNVKTIYLIPYNSKRGYFWPTKKYYPFNIIKEGRMNIVARFIPIIILYFICIVALLFALLFVRYNDQNILLLQYAIFAIIFPLAFKGIGSSKNEASSDAQLRFALESLEQLNSVQKNQIGFIFADTTKRQTVMKSIAQFLKSHNKNPLLIEPVFFSGEGIGIAANKFQSKNAIHLSKKYNLKSFLLEPLPEYYYYQRYLMLSYGSMDKDNDFVVKHDLKNKEVLNTEQFEKLKSLLFEIGSE